jgi:hypothetical protein
MNHIIPNQSLRLVYSRAMWESRIAKESGYEFTKEELDLAEKLETKFIGTKNGVECYLMPLFLDI